MAMRTLMSTRNEPRSAAQPSRIAAEWQLKPPYGARTILVILAVAIVMMVSSKNSEIDRMFYLMGEAAGNIVGLNESSQVVNGTKKIGESMFPIQISEVTEISRIENFDLEDLPMFTSIRMEKSPKQW